MKQRLSAELEELKKGFNYRVLPPQNKDGFVILNSNDYLGLAAREDYLEEFHASNKFPRLASTGSRLLSGNYEAYGLFEADLKEAYGREAALIYNSGYHLNIGVLTALSTKNDLIIADKLVHRSIIDGLRLCEADFCRFRHNNLKHLELLLEKNRKNYENIFIVSESLFSMDGDKADLKTLVELKNRYNAVLYIDEAHSAGCFGSRGLGLCEEAGLINDIDLIAVPMGKALAGCGAYLICDGTVKQYLINRSASMIFSTALPPVNIMWSRFIFSKLHGLKNERAKLAELSVWLKEELDKKGYKSLSSSHIIPIVIGDNEKLLKLSEKLMEHSFACSAVRYPTVAKNSARLRVSLHSGLVKNDLETFISIL